MPLQKYLELDSMYRNRNLDPLPSEFIVTMSQSGIRPQETALDPISNAYPQIIFTPTQYVNSADYSPNFLPNTYIGLFTLIFPPSTPTTLYFSITGQNLPIVPNFFVGLNLVHYQSNNADISGFPYRRITECECVQPTTTQIFKILIDSPFSTIIGNPTITQNFLIPIIANNALPLYFLPASLGIPNYYNNFLIQNLRETFTASPPTPNYTTIVDFDRDSHYATIGTTTNWLKTDTYVIRKEIPIITSKLTYNSTSLTQVVIGLSLVNNLGKQNLINAFFNYIISPTAPSTIYKINIKKIINIEDDFYIDPVTKEPVITNYRLILDSPLPNIPQINDCYEILQFSNDNYSPFVYSGTMSSNSQPVAYEISLNSISLPNKYLKNGGRIAYYPYVYVTLENVSSTSGNAKNLILSNNPHTYRATFKVPITDLNHPSITPFVKLTGNGMRQTMIFKQNDDMLIKIQLPNGELFETQEQDTSDGCAPNPTLQISTIFSMERIQ